MLSQLGDELEKALDDIANDLVLLADDVTSVTETMALVEGWRSNSRRQLVRLVKQLEHYGIVPMGGVQVPEEGTACKLSLSNSPRASSLLEVGALGNYPANDIVTLHRTSSTISATLSRTP